MSTRGIVYIAIGLNYLEMAISSAMSVLANCIEPINIVIFTDLALTRDCLGVSIRNITEHIEDVKQLSPGIISAYLKTQLYKLSPFDETLYLDSDVMAVADIKDVWSYCTDNIAVAPAYNPLSKGNNYSGLTEEIETSYYLLVDDSWKQYNTGVFLFNKSSVSYTVFMVWAEEWRRFRNYENMAFTRLNSYGFKFTELPSIYNQFYPDRNGDSVLIHYIGWCKKYLIETK
jgi:lipopolysaccharide biosynthesis glycosyltransferase